MVISNCETKPEIAYSLFKMGTMCAIFEVTWCPEVRENPTNIEEKGAITADIGLVVSSIQSDFKQASKKHNGLPYEPRIIDYEEIRNWTAGAIMYYKGSLTPYEPHELEEFRKALASKIIYNCN